VIPLLIYFGYTIAYSISCCELYFSVKANDEPYCEIK
jgi:hypothetical protein